MDGDAEQALQKARHKILDWVAARSAEAMPEGAYEGKPFELALGNGEVVAGTNCWAIRFDTADEELREKAGVERRWRTEALLLRPDGQNHAHFSMRLTVVTAASGVPFVRTTPKLRALISEAPGLLTDDLRVGQVFCPGSDESLREFLARKDRLPVVAISEDEKGEVGLDPGPLARSLGGFAHVVRLSSASSWVLSRVLGKSYSVFGGAVRIYLPGLDPSTQDFRLHPIWLKGSFDSTHGGARLLARKLLDRVLSFSSSRPDLDDLAPTFATVNAYLGSVRVEASRLATIAARELVQSAKSESDRLRALEAERDALVDERDSLSNQVQVLNIGVAQIAEEKDLAYDDNTKLQAEIQRMKGQIFGLTARSRLLESRLVASNGVGEIDATAPASLDELDEWAINCFPDRLVVLPKAIRAAKKSVYEDAGRVYECLKFLAVEYVDLRRGVENARQAFEKKAAHLRVEVSGVGDAAGDHRYRDQFRAPYQGGVSEIDLHLSPAKGTSERGSRDPKKTFRIYFFWDEEQEVVVVGSLPAHLTTGMTN